MQRSIKEIETVLRKELCGLCAHHAGGGHCGFGSKYDCATRARVQSSAEAISAVNGGRTEDFIRAVRERLCSSCPRPEPDGTCIFRSGMTNAMVIESLLRPPEMPAPAWRFRPTLVMEAVEKAIARLLRSKAD